MSAMMMAVVAPAIVAATQVGSALPEALRISGIALAAIFLVMGLFGTMITLLSKIFPEDGEEVKQS